LLDHLTIQNTTIMRIILKTNNHKEHKANTKDTEAEPIKFASL
jgi:hypothetical protein